MKICFMGTPVLAANILQNLISNNINISCVYTKPPKPQNRGLNIIKSPVHKIAESYNLQVINPKNFKTDTAIQQFNSFNFSLVIVVAYGLILPKPILYSPKYGCINVHGSLLPRWRGAAPIERCIEAGDTKTGITIMQMDEGLDTGDILLKQEIEITNTTTPTDIYSAFESIGTNLLLKTINAIKTNTLVKEKQNNSLATYANMLKKEEGLINWNNSAIEIERKIRAFKNFPTCYFIYKNSYIKVLKADVITDTTSKNPGTILENNKKLYIAAGNGSILSLTVLQKAGKKEMLVTDFLNGFKFNINDVL